MDGRCCLLEVEMLVRLVMLLREGLVVDWRVAYGDRWEAVLEELVLEELVFEGVVLGGRW